MPNLAAFLNGKTVLLFPKFLSQRTQIFIKKDHMILIRRIIYSLNAKETTKQT